MSPQVVGSNPTGPTFELAKSVTPLQKYGERRQAASESVIAAAQPRTLILPID